jgi:hypothetical protein
MAGPRPPGVVVPPTHQLTEVNAPDGAPAFCIEGCPHADTCPYDAVAIYRDLEPVLGDLAMTRRPIGLAPVAAAARRVRPVLARAPVEAVRSSVEWWRWPVAAVTDDHTPAGLDHALRTTRWGRCAYRVGDNDQPSSQTVAVQYANGVNASFTLQSTSYRSMRQVRVDGTRGSAVGELHALDGWLRARPQVGSHPPPPVPATYDGMAVGATAVPRLPTVRSGRSPRRRAGLDSHRIAFAAMRSAAEGSWSTCRRTSPASGRTHRVG